MPPFHWRLLLNTIGSLLLIWTPSLYCPRFDEPVCIYRQKIGHWRMASQNVGIRRLCFPTRSEIWPLNHFTPFIAWTWGKKCVQCLEFHSLPNFLRVPWRCWVFFGFWILLPDSGPRAYVRHTWVDHVTRNACTLYKHPDSSSIGSVMVMCPVAHNDHLVMFWVTSAREVGLRRAVWKSHSQFHVWVYAYYIRSHPMYNIAHWSSHYWKEFGFMTCFCEVEQA